MSQLINPYGSESFTPTFKPSFKLKSTTSGPSTVSSTPAPNNKVQPWLDHISDLSSPSQSVKDFVQTHYGGTSHGQRPETHAIPVGRQIWTSLSIATVGRTLSALSYLGDRATRGARDFLRR